MQETAKQLNLLVLISEKNAMLRKRCETAWIQQNHLSISPSELHLLTHVANRAASVSGIARSINVTRQAAHKGLSSLQEKLLVNILEIPGNKRDKQVMLTPLGESCYANYRDTIAVVEDEIAQTLGANNLRHLKTLLQGDW